MLILSRKKLEYIDISLPDAKIEICIVDVVTLPNGHSVVKVGINAPRNIPVDRREVLERKNSKQV